MPATGTWEIFRIFLGLGLTSFGGPIAHLGYYRTAFVTRRGWLSEAAYADLVALCQFLPGPASTQVSFSVGLIRGGWKGGLAAWCGFTLPSALLLLLFAYGAGMTQAPAFTGAIAGLKILAVAVVADAVYGMGRSLAPGGARLEIALAALAALGMLPGAGGQVAVILAGGLAGWALSLGTAADTQGAVHFQRQNLPGRGTGPGLVGLALLLLVIPPLLLAAGLGGPGLALFEAFYRAGALVFGGGHVVLPLLQDAVVAPGWTDADTFLAGYGAAQAVPGPIFTFAAYLGAVSGPPTPGGLTGAAIALVAIFLPGLLLVAGTLPWWVELRRLAAARAIMAGVNAAVVGVLAAALYDPVFTTGIRDTLGFAMAVAAFFALRTWKLPVWMVVIATAAAGSLRAVTGI
ncbi:chromate efflux transporter [Tropicimonas marinistellae]|uniref:chromate efflux transporter n=1 Tax=Tropicimonas marinistellae TaxID=1739787 RepID=UPI00082D6BFC|nr:chromate efflux transporter [Tropicimonas marinistellae]